MTTYRVIRPNDGGGGGANPAPGTSSSSSGNSLQAVLASPVNGQFYVIGTTPPSSSSSAASSADHLRTNPVGTTFVLDATSPATSTASLGPAPPPPKDVRRRSTHNEVERRRRDMINTGILKLGNLIPDLQSANAEGGASSGSASSSAQGKCTQSKGFILSKACEYVQDLSAANQELLEKLNLQDQVVLENDRLQTLVEELKQENAKLRQALDSHGILLLGMDSPSDPAAMKLERDLKNPPSM